MINTFFKYFRFSVDGSLSKNLFILILCQLSINLYSQEFNILSPNGGEFFHSSSNQRVYATSEPFQEYNLFIKYENENIWTKLERGELTGYNLLEKHTMFEVRMPAIKSDSCLLKVELASDSTLYDITDDYFKVSDSDSTYHFNFPLQPGNKWFFSYRSTIDSTIKTILEAVKDTLMADGKLYTQIDRLDLEDNIFNRNPGYLYLRQEDTIVYHYPDSIILNSNWSEQTDWQFLPEGIQNVRVYYDFILDDFRKTYYNRTFEWLQYVSFADGIGFYDLFALTWRDWNFDSRHLTGCIINDSTYGRILTDYIVGLDASKETERIIDFNLNQNYPNPFNPSTTIEYSIPDVGNENFRSTQIKIYDVLGNEIATLVHKQQRPGNYKVEWNAANLPSGIYLYNLSVGNFIETRKMILIK